MALVVITSAAVNAPGHGGGGGGTWHNLQAQPGAMGGGAVVDGGIQYGTWRLNKVGTAIHSVIYNAIISYSIDMHIKHEP